MGISMLGGIVGSILGGIFNAIFGKLMSWLSGVFNWVVNLLMKYIIAPFISFIVNLINYFLSIIWYNISLFILNLIDYVQVLFRALAGINDGDIKLTLSSGGNDGDLLIQLIQSEDVKNVFLSMCIVGVFLLVITTIFQIIKVEYTTEGAKNAKGPILNKAFKGLCNMIMIPALCICGVFIGNRVLELLDTATKPDENSTMAGQLFVAAAGDAFYDSKDYEVYISSPEPVFATLQLLTQIFPIAWNSARDAWGDVDTTTGEAGTAQKDGYTINEALLVTHNFNQDTVESNFSKNADGYSYYNIANVTRYYNISEINYLLLILGGCILIKTLYFTCFGMIVRLYQCGMLFIISPAVIGMTPINESGLSKWRSDFIGSAISAYGVVLAMNIYLILVKVLLSITFTFEGTATYYFGAGVMESLLKCVIVIGGALYIEKFSGQIGGYFGAKDALAQGKEMEKGVKDQAKKAVSTGITVAAMATGVGGAAISGAKGLAGAMKAGSAAAKKDGGSRFLGGLKGGASHIGGGIVDAGEKGIQQVTDRLGIKYESRSERKERFDLEEKSRKTGAEVDSAQKKYNAEVAYDKKYEDLKAQRAKINSMEPTSEKDMESKIAKINALDAQIAAMTPQVERRRAEGSIEKSRERLEKAQSADSDAKADLDKHNAIIDNRILLRKEAWSEAGKSGWQEKSFGGQLYSSVKKQMSGYEDAVIKKGGDAGYLETASKNLAKVKEDKAEKDFKDRNKKFVADQDARTERVQSKMFVEQMTIQNSTLDKQITSAMSNLDYFQQKKAEALAVHDTDTASRYDEKLIDGIESIAKQFGIAQQDIVRGAGGKYEITAKAQSEIKMDPNEFAGIVHKAFENMRKGMKQEDAIKDAVEAAISGKSADFARMIQKNVEEVMQKWNKDK